MNGEQKIAPAHLRRRAVIYVRQSSDGQVKNNLESQQLQYALVPRAKGLGFGDVEVLDVDLGASAAVAAKRREGFERLLGAVALGEVGLILSRELSRLLRTDKDFCQLVELCQLFDTLLGDDHTIYDVSRMDDQLVLGIKATMSVVELKVLRMRLLEGKENKAKRGELYPRLPPGYVWAAPGQVAKDPNLRVQEAMALIFAKFRETWSIRQTFKWFRDHEVEVPVTKRAAARRSSSSSRRGPASSPTCSTTRSTRARTRGAGTPWRSCGATGSYASGGPRPCRPEQARVFLPTTTRGTLTGRRSRSTNG